MCPTPLRLPRTAPVPRPRRKIPRPSQGKEGCCLPRRGRKPQVFAPKERATGVWGAFATPQRALGTFVRSKVPPRAAVTENCIVRKAGISVAIMVRRTITSVLWTFSQPHLSLKRKVPLTVPKKPCGGPVPLHPPSAPQGDCGPPNAPSNPLGDGGREILRPRREASPLGRARVGGCPQKVRCRWVHLNP